LFLARDTHIKTKWQNVKSCTWRRLANNSLWPLSVFVVVVHDYDGDDYDDDGDDVDRNNNAGCFDGSVVLWVSNSCRHCMTFTLLLGRI